MSNPVGTSSNNTAVSSGSRKRLGGILATVLTVSVLGGGGIGSYFGIIGSQSTGTALVSANVELSSQPYATLDIVLGWLKVFQLHINIHISSSSEAVSGPASELFAVEVFLKMDDVDPSTAKLQDEHSDELTPRLVGSILGDEVTFGDDVTIALDIQPVEMDFGELVCNHYSEICVEIRPVEDTIWQWKSDEEFKTACIDLGMCQYPIDADDLQLHVGSDLPGTLDFIMGSSSKTIVFDIDIGISNGSQSYSDVADSLFSVSLYFSDEFGEYTSSKSSIHELPSDMIMMAPGAFISLANISVNYDLTGMGCAQTLYLCVDVGPRSDSPWIWSGAGVVITDCLPVVTCQNQITASSIDLMVATGNDLNMIMGSDKTFTLDISIVTDRETADFEAETEFVFQTSLYLASDSEEARIPSTVSLPSTMVYINANHNIELLGVTFSDFSLNDLSCEDYTHVCVDISPVVGMLPYEWTWANEMAYETSCTQLNGQCQVQVTPDNQDPLLLDSTNVDVTMGYDDNSFIVNVEFSTMTTGTGKLSGNADIFFSTEIFFSNVDDPQGNMNNALLSDVFASVVSSDNVDIVSDTTIFFSIIADGVDLTDYQCQHYQYICIRMFTVPESGLIYGGPWGTQPGATCTLFNSCRNTIKYEYVPEAMNYVDASAYCGNLGKTLFDPFNQMEQNDGHYFLQKYFGGLDFPTIFMGPNDLENEGSWRHVDGSDLEYSNWIPGEPSNSGSNEDCMTALGSMLKWNDVACSNEYPFICQDISPCGSEFLCDNKHCISVEWECDGYDDCGDQSDEAHCPCYPQYECSDGTCIDTDSLCDSIDNDCPSNEDEEHCLSVPYTSCYPEFGCSNGDCFAHDLICDCPDLMGDPECGCTVDQFTCNTGSCIGSSLICNGFNDCSFGEDELNCCNSVEFRCNSGQCIPNYWHCDGLADCPSGEDEVDCSGNGGESNCNSNEFTCNSGDCIPNYWHCDNYVDCPSGEDESDCSGNSVDSFFPYSY